MSVDQQQKSRVLNVAIVGCGEVAQIVHLPNLALASHLYRVTALCDVSRQCLDHCGDKYHIPPEARFHDLEEMLKSSSSSSAAAEAEGSLEIEIDIVFILSPSELHVPQALLCLRYGKHLFIEKPLANTLAEVDQLLDAQARAQAALSSGGGVAPVVFVGYMRRYAAGVETVKERLIGKKINYVRVRELIGSNPMFTSQSGTYPLYPSDLPSSGREQITKIRQEAMIENFGEQLGRQAQTGVSWGILTNLASHDISAMREILGSPKSVSHASRSGPEGQGEMGWWSVVFDYGDYKAYYEMGIDQVPSFDAHIEIYTGDERILLQYDTPYVKGLPVTITIQSRLPSGEYSSQTIRPSYEDPYTFEMRELYKCVVNGKEVRTSVKDARRDTELAIEIIKALK